MPRLAAVTAVALHTADDVMRERRRNGEEGGDASGDQLNQSPLRVGERQPGDVSAYTGDKKNHHKG